MTDALEAVMATFDVSPEQDVQLRQSVSTVLLHIHQAGLCIAPVTPLIASDIHAFEASVIAHLTPSDVNAKVDDLDASDVNGEAVIHELRSKGWLILPPK